MKLNNNYYLQSFKKKMEYLSANITIHTDTVAENCKMLMKEIKDLNRSHLTMFIFVFMDWKNSNKCWQRMQKLGYLYIAHGNINGMVLWRILQFKQKQKTCNYLWVSNSTFAFLSQRNENLWSQNSTWMFITAFHNSSKLETTWNSFSGWMIKAWYISTTELYIPIKRNRL